MISSKKNRDFKPELKFYTSRSSGPGGQNVNKVNTKVELRFSIEHSALLRDSEKDKLRTHLKNRINSDDELLLVSQNHRSQLQNKEDAIHKFNQLIYIALKPVKKRRATRPTRSSVERRLQHKKEKSQRKILRGKQFE